MQILAVRFQNCFSFGNQITEIRFDKTKTTLVVGRNGGGKSSAVLDTLVYGLYGKPYRRLKKLSQMINSITGRDMLVEVDLRVRGRSYTIRRGQKPALFEVHCDGELVNQAASVKEQQEWLEKSVLRMDYRAFCQIVVLGSANHVPFMQLPAAQRREVIEDILDIQVFSAMNEVLKEKASELKEELAQNDKDLAVARKELEVEERNAAALAIDRDQRMRETTDQIVAITERLVEDKAAADAHSRKASSLAESISDAESVEKKARQIEIAEAKLKDKIKAARREIEFFRDHENCPTCRQTIDSKFREEASARRVAELEEAEELVEKLSQQKMKVDERLSELREIGNQILDEDRAFARLQAQIRQAEEELARLESRRDSAEEAQVVDQERLTKLRERVALLSSEHDEIQERAWVLRAAGLLLKDGGIKTQIVRQYIPLMNRLVNKYLASLELFVDFHLDEEFNEEIRSRHRDAFSYESFSEGEKLRIDLAILFAWRDIARMRSSSAVDLVIFDEILDGSLDAEGADYFLRLVHEQTDDCRVFIISHREGLDDKFSRVLSFAKRSNFSGMTETG